MMLSPNMAKLTGGLAAATVLTGGLALASPAPAFATSTLSGLFGRVAVSAKILPNRTTVVRFGTSTGMATVTIPAGTFAETVHFVVRNGFLGNFAVPAGQKAIFDFAFQVTTPDGTPVPVPFKKPVVFRLQDPALCGKSLYYNVTPSGALAVNPKGMKLMTGHGMGMANAMIHPINTDTVGWVITSPVKAKASGPLAMQCRIGPTVFLFDNGTVKIPGGTFTTPVRFTVLAGALHTFMVPAGQMPIFDFAFRVTTLAEAPVPVPFHQAVLFILRDPMLTAHSVYDNVTPGGMLAANPKGMKMTKAGGMGMGRQWVIRLPIRSTPMPWVG
jgi:hypothetical protein